jgi:hypothetical protein
VLRDERLDRQAVDAGLDRPDRLVPSQAERDQLLDLVLFDPDDLVARNGRASGFASVSCSDGAAPRRLGVVTKPSQGRNRPMILVAGPGRSR